MYVSTCSMHGTASAPLVEVQQAADAVVQLADKRRLAAAALGIRHQVQRGGRVEDGDGQLPAHARVAPGAARKAAAACGCWRGPAGSTHCGAAAGAWQQNAHNPHAARVAPSGYSLHVRLGPIRPDLEHQPPGLGRVGPQQLHAVQHQLQRRQRPRQAVRVGPLRQAGHGRHRRRRRCATPGVAAGDAASSSGGGLGACACKRRAPLRCRRCLQVEGRAAAGLAAGPPADGAGRAAGRNAASLRTAAPVAARVSSSAGRQRWHACGDMQATTQHKHALGLRTCGRSQLSQPVWPAAVSDGALPPRCCGMPGGRCSGTALLPPAAAALLLLLPAPPPPAAAAAGVMLSARAGTPYSAARTSASAAAASSSTAPPSMPCSGSRMPGTSMRRSCSSNSGQVRAWVHCCVGALLSVPPLGSRATEGSHAPVDGDSRGTSTAASTPAAAAHRLHALPGGGWWRRGHEQVNNAPLAARHKLAARQRLAAQHHLHVAAGAMH